MHRFSDLKSKPTQADAEQAVQEAGGYVFDIKRYAIHDGPGIRTTVFFKGCPLQCRWCHNPESWNQYPEPSVRHTRCVGCGRCVEVCRNEAISLVEDRPITNVEKCTVCGECVDACLAGAREIVGWRATAEQIMAEIEKDIVFYDQSGGGATFSGGEPLMQPQFLLALLRKCRRKGIHTAVDTTCYADPATMREVAAETDLFLCDVKHMNSDIHREYTGVDNELILDNIRNLSEASSKIVIRVPIVPGFNDDRANIEMTAEFVASLTDVDGIDILPYNNGGTAKAVRLAVGFDLMKTEVPGDRRMEEIAKTLRNYGFQVKIGG